MSVKLKKTCAVLVTLCIIISCIPTVTVFATTSQPAVTNWGTRDQICTDLSDYAEAYYTGDYTVDKLFGISGGSTLHSELQELMSKQTHIASYQDCEDLMFYIDCENNNTDNATTIYTDYSITHTQWGDSWGGSWACNREHIWPQNSGGGDTTGGGADLHHLRPEDASANSSRGNTSYGNVVTVTGTTKGSSAVENAVAGVYGKGASGTTYFEPNDNVKGDVARICLYVYVRWGSDWGASNIKSVFESVEVLLEWCELDPVDTWEMGRNDAVQSIQGNRNVFIDYPELAWLIFDEQVPADMVTPSKGEASGGDNNEQTTEKITETQTEEQTESTPIAPDQSGAGIVSSNVYYGDTIKFMFASHEKPSIYSTDKNGNTTYFGVEEYIENGKQLTYNGYPVWISSSGVSFQNIAMHVTVTAGGESQQYSVLEYLYTRLYVSENVTAAQKTMYNNLIDYSQKLDVVLGNTSEVKIGSECIVSVKGGTLNGSQSTDLVALGATPFMNISTDLVAGNGKTIEWTVSVNGGEPEIRTLDEIKAMSVSTHTVVTAVLRDEKPTEPANPTVVLEITKADFNGTSYAANNSTHTKGDYSYTSYQVMNQSSAMQWQKSKGYITLDANDFVKLEIKVTAGTFTVTVGGVAVNESTADGISVYDLSGLEGEIKIAVGGATGKVDYIKFYK